MGSSQGIYTHTSQIAKLPFLSQIKPKLHRKWESRREREPKAGNGRLNTDPLLAHSRHGQRGPPHILQSPQSTFGLASTQEALLFQKPSSPCYRKIPKPCHKMDSAPQPTVSNSCPYGKGSQKYPLKGNNCVPQRRPGNTRLER